MTPRRQWVVRKGSYFTYRNVWIVYRWNAFLRGWSPWLVDLNSWRGVMNQLDAELWHRWVTDLNAPAEPPAVER